MLSIRHKGCTTDPEDIRLQRVRRIGYVGVHMEWPRVEEGYALKNIADLGYFSITPIQRY